ncbi:hypothetical protein H6S82_24070 [Planktothrix sp. FACHB-1355]|uniref:Uncharacterized protein n=1 Tax=Aerosakkonema funiforme FACHB-1375 TaxID=2949571 RepID=A0A926ZLD6_9CYAN|nr:MULTISPECIES: hypothetical protein [Oscillatoriales]MBD2186292.1 hypothetical protein [Aerosakkonema funiforme FACHB-1375]MBD3561897.1 hypothetical protein [Planktothrix sp. FACHB-1355]
MDGLQAERIESVKAGSFAALSLFLAYGIATLGNQLVLAKQFEVLASLQISTAANLLLSGAIAIISGFLFGITYRYIIREDRNSHLSEGAVLAFGLVRGLAQADVGLNFDNAFWSCGVLAVESIVLFAIARYTLDVAIDRGWLKPFRLS